MAGLDTNILVRYLTQDDEIQSALASRLIDHATENSLFLLMTVVLEMEWVLRSRYKFDKAKFIQTIQKILMIQSIYLKEEETVLNAVWLYRNNKADFADCLHTALIQAESQSPMLTFDENASKIESNQLLNTHYFN